MYLRDERLRLYQASLEVTVTINRLSIYKLSEWLSLFAVSIAVIDVQDTAYVIRDWVPYSVRNPAGIIHSRLNSNRVTQGDPLAMILYDIALAPLIEGLHRDVPGWYSPGMRTTGDPRERCQIYAG